MVTLYPHTMSLPSAPLEDVGPRYALGPFCTPLSRQSSPIRIPSPEKLLGLLDGLKKNKAVMPVLGKYQAK